MNKEKKFLTYLLLFFLNLTFTIPIKAKISIPNISIPYKSVLPGSKKEELIQKEFSPVKKIELLAPKANLIVHTWKQNSIILEIKKNGSQVQLQKTELNIYQDEDILQIEIASPDDASKAQCEIQLIVPEQIDLSTHIDYGNISIKKLNGIIIAHTNHGTIKITDSNHGGMLSTDRGNIIIQQEQIAESELLKAHTDQGNITLQVPQHINCEIAAHTKKGKISSDLFITLQPYSTKLNHTQQKQQRQQINGSIVKQPSDQLMGSIEMTNNAGNISIKPYF